MSKRKGKSLEAERTVRRPLSENSRSPGAAILTTEYKALSTYWLGDLGLGPNISLDFSDL